MTLSIRGLHLGACGAVLAAACTPDFQSASQVTDLRVLAIRQEAIDEPDAGSSRFADAFIDLAASTVQPVRVKALVADPQPRRALAVGAHVCSPTDSGRCDVGPSLDLRAPNSSLASATEQQPQYMLDSTRAIPPELIAGARQDDRLKGFGGIRVQFSLEVDDGDPHGPVLASKTLLYSTAPEAMRNQNPDIVRLEITRDGAHVATVAEGETLAITAGVEYGVRPLLGAGTSGIEEYDAVDLSGNLVHLREEPRYSFFATSPIDVDRDQADEPLPGQPEPANGIARFSTAAGPGSLWVVVRDGRGGIGWIGVRCSATPP